MIADGFGNSIRIRLGRLDATEPAPAGRLPAPGAPLEEVQAFFSRLGAKPDLGNKKPPFWERQQVGGSGMGAGADGAGRDGAQQGMRWGPGLHLLAAHAAPPPPRTQHLPPPPPQYLIWPAAQADPAAAEQAMADFSPQYGEGRSRGGRLRGAALSRLMHCGAQLRPPACCLRRGAAAHRRPTRAHAPPPNPPPVPACGAAGWKKQYDISKTTVTRTSYEEDLGATLSLLADQGAKFDKDYYLCPIGMLVPDRL